MMIHIPSEEYISLGPLFGGLQDNLAVDSILLGSTPGRVYPDRFPLPQTGLLWDGQAALFPTGEPQANARRG